MWLLRQQDRTAHVAIQVSRDKSVVNTGESKAFNSNETPFENSWDLYQKNLRSWNSNSSTSSKQENTERLSAAGTSPSSFSAFWLLAALLIRHALLAIFVQRTNKTGNTWYTEKQDNVYEVDHSSWVSHGSKLLFVSGGVRPAQSEIRTGMYWK